MAAVTLFSDFGAPQNKVSHCFHCFPIYLPWNDETGCHDLQFSSVQLPVLSELSSRRRQLHRLKWGLGARSSVLQSDSLQPHESQIARPPCPSPTPGVHSNSCPLSRRCHSAISSSVIPFFSCPQSLPASESFPMSQLFAWGGQSTGVSALASFLPKNTQDRSPLE